MKPKALEKSKINLSERHYKIYNYLAENEGENLNQRMIAEHLAMPYSTVRNIIKKFRATNLIKVHREDHNRFASFVINKKITVETGSGKTQTKIKKRNNSLVDAILNKFTTEENFPYLKKIGFRFETIFTLMEAWKGRGRLNEFPEAIALSEYAIENGIKDKNGYYYSYETLFFTLWRNELPCQTKKNMQALPLAVKLDLSLDEKKLLEFIIQMGAAPLTIDLITHNIGAGQKEISEMLGRFQNEDLIKISTDLDETFISITINCHIVFDGHDYIVFRADGNDE